MVIGERTLVSPIFSPVSATETELFFTYDKGNIIKIDENGVIQALAEGTVTITGSTEYGVSASFTVTVSNFNFADEIAALQNYILERTPLVDKKFDMNEDGEIDVFDLALLKRKYIYEGNNNEK
ncbi:hypothetical protein FACS1894132_12590 [Clostridia bacterium]|nr:hypothetical protein FACS1894132_12590 [Clostridia bacterium]